jgi:hypothetical protein
MILKAVPLLFCIFYLVRTITIFSAYMLIWTEVNRITHFLKNLYYQLLPHFRGALYFGVLPRTESGFDAQWFGNLTFVYSFWNSPSCFQKILRNHRLFFRGLLTSSSDQERLITSSVCFPLSTTECIRKWTLQRGNIRECSTDRLLLSIKFDLEFRSSWLDVLLSYN